MAKKAQPYSVGPLIGGVDSSLDPIFINDKASPSQSTRNVRFHRGLLKKNLGWSNLGTGLPLDGPVMMIDNFYLQSGSEYTIVATTKWIYTYDSISGVYIKINPLVDMTVTSTHAAASLSLVFDRPLYTITRADAGSWITDGFVAGATITTTAPNNPGPFHCLGVTAKVLTLEATGVIVGETVTCVATATVYTPTAVALTFTAAGKTITRATGSWTVDGFTEGTIVLTSSTTNPGPFTITHVTASVLTVAETVVNESATKDVSGMVPLTGTEDDQFSGETTLDAAGQDMYVITNGTDPILKWYGGISNFIRLLGLGGITAKALAIFQSRLILGNTEESGYACPRRVRWCIAGDPEDWVGTGSGFLELVDTVDWVTCFVMIKNNLFIVKERTILQLGYVGEPTYFLPQIQVDGTGSYSPMAVVSLGEEALIVGSDDVYLFDGLELTPVGGQVFQLLYDTETKIVNATKLNRAPGAYIEELKEYWICVPTQGESPDILLKYGFDNKSWAIEDKAITAFGFFSIPSDETWAEAVGIWSTDTALWVLKALPAGAPTTLMGRADGYVMQDDRLTPSTNTMVFETKDFILAQASRVTEVCVFAKSGPFSVSYSIDGGDSYSEPKVFSYSAVFRECVMGVDITTQTIRFKLVSTADDMEVRWIQPWYIPRVRSQALKRS